MKDIVYVIWNVNNPPSDIRSLQQYKTLTNCQKIVNSYNKSTKNINYKVQPIQLKLI